MAVDYPEARELMLAAVLPATTDVFIGLWDGSPIDGGTELTLTGYARVAHQAWTTSASPGESMRSNSIAITFGEITQAGVASYWSIHDGSVEPSTLLRSGSILDDLNQPFTINFSGAGDEPQFNIGALRIKIQEQ